MTEGRRRVARIPLVVGNWKMFKTSEEGAVFVHELAAALGNPRDREVMVAPPFTGLFQAVAAASGSCVRVAAQDVFWEWEGAFTGEVSATMLAGLGVAGSIVGHSERRMYFGETDESAAKKVWSLLEHGLVPILCVGETEDERERGTTERVLESQISAGLAAVRPKDATGVVIAYEPIWAIGTGRTATPEMAQEAIGFVRRQVAANLGPASARRIRILYGGSVGPHNIDELMAQPDLDGVLVGGASLHAESFVRIVQFERQ
jgi:triosephosphate isomerase